MRASGKIDKQIYRFFKIYRDFDRFFHGIGIICHDIQILKFKKTYLL